MVAALSFRPVIVRHTGAVCFAKFFPHQGLPGIDSYLQNEWQEKDHGNTVKMQTKAGWFAAEHKWDVGKSTIDILRLYFTYSTKKK
ncbi:hypothetical protein EPI10_007573 [Gossypium australe]|uniref:Uncharacterized protein n=1 Tax=Gossypium australe TaxID=47621 RepID=A0A5B6WY43_9ROSI|nr:hypothetical protein EPI10_007573 [Gossypium australe]